MEIDPKKLLTLRLPVSPMLSILPKLFQPKLFQPKLFHPQLFPIYVVCTVTEAVSLSLDSSLSFGV